MLSRRTGDDWGDQVVAGRIAYVEMAGKEIGSEGSPQIRSGRGGRSQKVIGTGESIVVLAAVAVMGSVLDGSFD